MEKRKCSRVGFEIQASIFYKNTIIEGFVKDLSLTGIFLIGTNDIPLGEDVSIIIRLAGNDSNLSVSLYGKITRCNESGLGIEFDAIDLDSFIHLKNIIIYNYGDSDKIMDEFLTKDT